MLVALKTLDARYPALLDACVAGASRAFATFYLWTGNGHLLTRENQSIPESMYQVEIARELVEQRVVGAVTLEENLRYLGQANAPDSESGRADIVGWRRVGAELKPFAAVEVKRGDLKLAEDIARVARLYASCSLELGVVVRAARFRSVEEATSFVENPPDGVAEGIVTIRQYASTPRPWWAAGAYPVLKT